jgi:hypothetical protein
LAFQLGMITLDNASNNDTLMAQLEEYMTHRGLDFDRHGNRLRCVPDGYMRNVFTKKVTDASHMLLI